MTNTSRISMSLALVTILACLQVQFGDAATQRKDLTPTLLKAIEDDIAQGANVYAKNREGETALAKAIDGGGRDMVRLLLDKGVDVNERERDGWTALMRAVALRDSDIVTMLLGRGADVNMKDKKGKTALECLTNLSP